MLVPIRVVGLSNTAGGLRKSECDTMHGIECGGLPFIPAWSPAHSVHAFHNLHYGCGIGVELYAAVGFRKSKRENVTHLLLKSAGGKCPFM